MRGAIPPLPQYAFMAWYLVKHRDKFTFYHLRVGLPSDLYLSVFVFGILYAFPYLSTCFTHLILLYLISVAAQNIYIYNIYLFILYTEFLSIT
jgi:hypothetical protein